jgi:hypothetical protein
MTEVCMLPTAPEATYDLRDRYLRLLGQTSCGLPLSFLKRRDQVTAFEVRKLSNIKLR